MLKFVRRYPARLLPALCLLIVFWAVAGPVSAMTFSYNGRWEAQEDDNGRLLQNNRQGVSWFAEQDITRQLEIDENLRYYYSWRERDTKKEIVSPGLGLRLGNDLFSANVGALANKNLSNDSTTASSTTIDSSLISNWQKDFVPSVKVFYGYLESNDELDVHVVDSTDTSYGGKVDWDLRLVQTYYTYEYNLRKEMGRQQSEADGDKQSAGIRFTRNFWDNRLQVKLSQEYQENTSTREFVVDSPNGAEIPQAITEVRTGPDTPPDDSIEPATLVSNNAMRDNDLLTPVYAVSPNTVDNSIMLLMNGQQVDRIYLYTEPTFNGTTDLSWRLYSNDILGTPWTAETPVDVIFDSANHRFVMTLDPSLSVEYLKVVLDLGPLASPFSFTEAAASQITLGQPVGSVYRETSDQKIDRTNADVDFRFNQTMMMFYKLALTKEQDDGADFSELTSHNVGLNYNNTAHELRSSLNYRYDKRWHKPDSESESANYQFFVGKQVLPTLSVSGDFSRSEVTQKGAKLSTTDSYKIYCDAQLYPDLTARLDGNYISNKNNQDDGLHKFETYDSNLDLTSRLRPSLILNLSFGYQKDLDQGNEVENTNQVIMNLSWQISDFLSTHLTASQISNEIASDITSYGASAAIGMTENMELEVQYNLVDTRDIIAQTGRVKWSWNIRKYLTWESWVDYREANNVSQLNNTKLFCQLSANFSTN